MKRFWAVLVAVGLCLFVASCADDSSDSSSSSGVNDHGPLGPNAGTETSTSTEIPKFAPIGGVFTTNQNLTITCKDASKIYFFILEEPRDGSGNWDEETANTGWKALVAKSSLGALGKVAEAPSDATSVTKDTAANTITAGKWYSYVPGNAPTITLSERCVIRAIGEVAGKNGEKIFRTAMTAFDFYDQSAFTSSNVTQTPTRDANASKAWADESIYFIMIDRFNVGGTNKKTTANLKKYKEDGTTEAYAGEGTRTDANNEDHYDGGNLAGIKAKLDYIKDMGFTSIFITPPIKNLIFDGTTHGYHGYWPSDFMAIDPHKGDLAAYQALVKTAHEKGLRVIQDFPINGLGDYQRINKDISATLTDATKATDITSGFALNTSNGIAPLTHPESLPWALNDVRNYSMDDLQYSSPYNFNTKKDGKPLGQPTAQLEDLDDIRYADYIKPLLRGYLRYWIDAAGVDGYRFSSVMGVTASNVREILNRSNIDDQGVINYSTAQKGDNTSFIVFGEVQSSTDAPKETEVANYTKGMGFNYVQNAALAYSLRQAIAEQNTVGLRTTLTQRGSYGYKDGVVFINYIDDHNTSSRWLDITGGNEALTKMGYNVLYTLEGIPQVYYGSEQGLTARRQAMFDGGFKYDSGKDFSNTTGDWYKYFTALNKMRKDFRVFRHNKLTVLTERDSANGVFAYMVEETNQSGDKLTGAGQKAIIVQNPSDTSVTLSLKGETKGETIIAGDKFTLVDKLAAPALVDGKTAGEDGAYTITKATAPSNPSPYDKISVAKAGSTPAEDFTVGKIESGTGDTATVIPRINLEVPAQSSLVYVLSVKGESVSADTTKLEITKVNDDASSSVAITDPKENDPDITEIIIKGKSTTAGSVDVVIDDNLKKTVSATANTEFTATFKVASLSIGTHYIKLVQNVSGSLFISDTKILIIDRAYKFNTEVMDKAADDHGVPISVTENGQTTTVAAPLNPPTYQEEVLRSTQDIRGVEVYTNGSNIRLGLRMTNISHDWNPQTNSFDHVAFYVFIARKDKTTSGGSTPATCTAFPLGGNYTFPAAVGSQGDANYIPAFEGWDYLYIAEGWNNQFYSSKGAGANNKGTVAGPTPTNDVKINWDSTSNFIDEKGTSWNWVKPDWTKQWKEDGTYQAPTKDLLIWTGGNQTPPIAHNQSEIIWLTISADAIGNPEDITGWKIFITTWDFDNGSPRDLVKFGTVRTDGTTVQKAADEPYKFTTKYNNVPHICDALDQIIVIK